MLCAHIFTSELISVYSYSDYCLHNGYFNYNTERLKHKVNSRKFATTTTTIIATMVPSSHWEKKSK